VPGREEASKCSSKMGGHTPPNETCSPSELPHPLKSKPNRLAPMGMMIGISSSAARRDEELPGQKTSYSSSLFLWARRYKYVAVSNVTVQINDTGFWLGVEPAVRFLGLPVTALHRVASRVDHHAVGPLHHQPTIPVHRNSIPTKLQPSFTELPHRVAVPRRPRYHLHNILIPTRITHPC